MRALFILIALMGLVAFMPVREIAKRPRKPREMHHGMPVIIDAPDKSGNESQSIANPVGNIDIYANA